MTPVKIHQPTADAAGCAPDAKMRLRTCPFCGGPMQVRKHPEQEIFGAECQRDGCGAMGPIQHDELRAALASNRRGFVEDVEADPCEDAPPPALDTAWWHERLRDENDLVEFCLVHEKYGQGFWGCGADAGRRKIEAVAESQQGGWTMVIRSLLHGEVSYITLKQVEEIICKDCLDEPDASHKPTHNSPHVSREAC